MDKKVFELEFNGEKIIVECNYLAKQADSSVLIRYGDTVVLTAIVQDKKETDSDFFPLTVIYNEKLYAVGKIPGGFIKREGRPTENATLAARLIDRSIRPLFDENFKQEIQVINDVLSVDQNIMPESVAFLGSSLALSISRVPFSEPVAGVLVGYKNKEYIINPNAKQVEEGTLLVFVAGTKQAINMVEAEGEEIDEEIILKSLELGHKYIKQLVSFQEEIIKEIGQEKIIVEKENIAEGLKEELNNNFKSQFLQVIKIKDKIERYEKIDNLKEEIISIYQEKEDEVYNLKQIKALVDNIEWEVTRDLILKEKIRVDGRGFDEIRELFSEVDILPRTHGSALFSRGQTQVLSTTTLGALGEYQILDGLGVEDSKRFMHHYNFPAFSVGETGRYGYPNRREIGHGALGEKALLQIIPSEEEFPYTIRVVSEVLESNGSSSQASICAACMSLMAAGVPIKEPIAGIAMGLISDETKKVILTDIQGTEDHLGDMDLKVAGTKNGVCALQMDIKIKGIDFKILKEALFKAKEARLKILENMSLAIKEPRKELSPYAPKIKQIQIKPSKIKDVIGRGGETITKLIEECDDVKIDIEDDGRVIIYHTNYEMINKAISLIEELVKEVETGKVYSGKVVKIESFGCFVELWPGCEGLVHISQLDDKRVNKTEDIVRLGDEILVKSLGFDKKGRLNLSRRDVKTKRVD
jgi:polyribonucleotide nucleotidyltransferase